MKKKLYSSRLHAILYRIPAILGETGSYMQQVNSVKLRVLYFGISLILVPAVFCLVYHFAGSIAGMIPLFILMIYAWMCGLLPGIVFAVALVPVTLVLYSTQMHLSLIEVLAARFFLIGTTSTLLSGIIVGHNSDLMKKLKQKDRSLHHRTYYDDVTGLPNRLLLTQFLQRSIAHLSRRENYFFALLFVDIDHFNRINDSLGHDFGDSVLKAFSQSLLTHVREGDVVARFSGDEFMILLDDVRSYDDITPITNAVLEKIRRPIIIGDQKVFLTASIGVVCAEKRYYSPEELIRDADTAMNKAKVMGGNTFSYFNIDHHTSGVQRLEMEQGLRDALIEENLDLYCQPFISLTDRKTIGFETLLRWIRPSIGIVEPLAFVPLAEETGLIHNIGRWVVLKTFEYLRELERLGHNDLFASVNVSAVQLHNEEFVKFLQSEFIEHTSLIKKCHLELTESVLVKGNYIVKLLEDISSIGFRISLDDFATGYSSLGYLSRLPIATIKIDKSFVASIGFDRAAENLIKMLLAVAETLQLSVIAEGIETDAQFAFLKELKCPVGQGYLFGRPVPFKEFTDNLKSLDSVSVEE